MSSDELTQLLHEERELPTPEFSAKLDAWAAAGFPRAESPRKTRSGWDAFRQRLASTPPRRIIAPAGAALTLVVITAVAIGGNFGSSDEGGTVAVQSVQQEQTGAGGGGESADSTASGGNGGLEALPESAGKGGGAPQVGAAIGANSDSLTDKSAKDVPFDQRKIARTVDLSLATSAGDFRDAADGVFDVVESHRGFVRTSNVTGGDPDVSGSQLGQARFDLRIPASQLDSALAELSDLGHVVSRSDGAHDITSSFVAVKKRIADLEETRANLLKKLEDATTDAERDSIQRNLAIVNAQLNAAEGKRSDLQRRVQLVPVTVSIAADNSIGGGAGGDDGSWSIGDAIDDAGRVLEVGAGVLVISAAVLVPVGLVVVIGLLSGREIRRRQREAALD
jgi:hypothetical protein